MPQNLYKSRTNKVIDGVCGGLGEYFNIDPTIIRLIWALAIFVGGAGVILYILAMFIIPTNPEKQSYNTATPPPPPPSSGAKEGESLGDQQEEEQGQETASTPPPPPKTEYKATPTANNDRGPLIVGLILIAFGAYYLLNRFFPFFSFRYWWPVLLIILGVFIITKGKGKGGTR